ncbi:kinase-like domain-containing protein [Tirmania nivea]|nr:kinase-like domain-containing protein [Tirmania nivea]
MTVRTGGTSSLGAPLPLGSSKSSTATPGLQDAFVENKPPLAKPIASAPVKLGAELAEDLNEEIKNKYTKDKKIGEGTYAIVYLGHTKTHPPTRVAIKKIKAQTILTSGLSMDAIREVKYLQELHHPNIILLLDVFSSKNQNLNLVLEFLDGDLEMIIKDTRGIMYSLADMKSWMLMALRGVWWCHHNHVLHRDIKPNNLLISSTGVLKLGDFGLARSLSDPYRPMTHNVITRWYRPPELLFGARFYSTAVDIWSLGCVLAELLLRVPFIAGNSDVHQVELICNVLGTPNEENWPGVTSLPGYAVPSNNPGQPPGFWETMFGHSGHEGVRLLKSMMELDPRKRVSAKSALEDPWFRIEPRPTRPERLPRKGGTEGESKIGEDLKRVAGGDEGEPSGGVGGPRGGNGSMAARGKGVARKLDFGGL